MSARAEELAAKYDRLAASYSARYRDPGAIASRQVGLALNWGAAPRPGGRILELGCSDGFVTAELVRAGFAVTGVDLSPGMIAVARARLQREGLVADLRVAGAERFEPDGTYDVAIALMWTFFAYVAEPAPVLRRLAGATRKLILDVNPRQMPLRVAMDQVRTAGFSDVSWRPFLLPQRVRLPGPVRALLELGERVPGLRALPLRWKFSAVVKGER